MAVSEADGFAGSLAEEIEFCTPRFATSDRPDIDDVRGMQGEDSLDALIVDDSSDGEGFVNSTASSGDYSAGEYLYTLFVAFLDAATDIYGIAYFEMRYLLLETLVFNGVEQVGF